MNRQIYWKSKGGRGFTEVTWHCKANQWTVAPWSVTHYEDEAISDMSHQARWQSVNTDANMEPNRGLSVIAGLSLAYLLCLCSLEILIIYPLLWIPYGVTLDVHVCATLT